MEFNKKVYRLEVEKTEPAEDVIIVDTNLAIDFLHDDDEDKNRNDEDDDDDRCLNSRA